MYIYNNIITKIFKVGYKNKYLRKFIVYNNKNLFEKRNLGNSFIDNI